MYVVIVRVRVLPGTADRFIELSRLNQAGTRTEPGNIRWELLRVAGETDRFVLDEAYVDEAAFKAHQQQPHYFAWKDAVAGMMAEPRSADKCVSVE